MASKGRWVVCPECGNRVLLRNIKKHYREHHPGVQPPRESELLKREKRWEQSLKERIPWRGIAAAIVISILILSGFWWYTHREEGLKPKEVGFFTEDGMYIFAYLLIQDTSHPTIVLLHDLNQDHHAFDPYLEYFYSMGYNVCTLDLRGYGKSVWKRGERITLQDIQDHEYANYTKDVGGLLRYLKNNYEISERFTMLGAGLGASVGALYAVHDTKVKSVVLISPQMEIMHLGLYRFTEEYGARPIMVVASTQNPSAHSSAERIYEGAKDGRERLYVDDPITSVHLLSIEKVRVGVGEFLNETLPV
ncbi:MAG: alpha/beta hydrolase [Thermoplasmata archaeon]|nr:alpha/beta hydrolase [Thermoplasmata archaeon]